MGLFLVSSFWGCSNGGGESASMTDAMEQVAQAAAYEVLPSSNFFSYTFSKYNPTTQELTNANLTAPSIVMVEVASEKEIGRILATAMSALDLSDFSLNLNGVAFQEAYKQYLALVLSVSGTTLNAVVYPEQNQPLIVEFLEQGMLLYVALERKEETTPQTQEEAIALIETTKGESAVATLDLFKEIFQRFQLESIAAGSAYDTVVNAGTESTVFLYEVGYGNYNFEGANKSAFFIVGANEIKDLIVHGQNMALILINNSQVEVSGEMHSDSAVMITNSSGKLSILALASTIALIESSVSATINAVESKFYAFQSTLKGLFYLVDSAMNIVSSTINAVMNLDNGAQVKIENSQVELAANMSGGSLILDGFSGLFRINTIGGSATATGSGDVTILSNDNVYVASTNSTVLVAGQNYANMLGNWFLSFLQ